MSDLTLDELVRIIPLAWSDEVRGSTRLDTEHQSAGLVLATAMLIQKHCGGDIISCAVGGDSWRSAPHYINELEHGVKIDVCGKKWRRQSPYRKFKKLTPAALAAADPNLEHANRAEILEYKVKDILNEW